MKKFTKEEMKRCMDCLFIGRNDECNEDCLVNRNVARNPIGYDFTFDPETGRMI